MEVSFHPMKEEACQAVSSIVRHMLKDKTYQQEMISDWISRICDEIIEALKKMSSCFKYIVSCIISEKASFEVQNSCQYSPFDANCLIQWENTHLSVIINLFAVAL